MGGVVWGGAGHVRWVEHKWVGQGGSINGIHGGNWREMS